LPESFNDLYTDFVINSHCEKIHSANVQVLKLQKQKNAFFFIQ